MPSALIGIQSGGVLLFSGYLPYSGHPSPVGTVQLRWDPNASGNAYVSLSGGVTVNSGGFFLSGTSGLMDGFPLKPGDPYAIPKLAITPSGQLNIWVTCDAAASGQARMYWEFF